MPRRPKVVDPFGTYLTERSVNGNRLKDISLAYSKRRSWFKWLNYGRKVAKGIAVFGGGAGLASLALGTAAEYGVSKAVDYFSTMDAPPTEPRAKRPRRSYSDLLPTFRQPQMRGRKELDRGGYSQMEYSYDRSGVRLSKEQRMLKALTPALYPKIDRWQRLSQATSDLGAFSLSCQSNAAFAEVQMPLYCWDLTSIEQELGTDPTVPVAVYAVPGTRCYFDTATDTFKWAPVSCLRSDGSTVDPRWQTELGARLTPNIANNLPKATPKCFFDWADIKMVIYGPRTFPSTVKVSIVQFTDVQCKPDAWQTLDGVTSNLVAENNSGTLSGNDANRYKDFWTSYTDKLVANPITKRGFSKVPGVMNVLYSKTFEFNPTMLDENDARGHQMVFNYRYNHNKVIDYAWDMQDASIVDGFMQYPNFWQQQNLTRTINVTPSVKGRVYLMVEGYASQYKQDPTTADLYNFYPSFDVMIRRKTVHVHGITEKT